MSDSITLPDNSQKFLDKCANIYGNFRNECFNITAWSYIQESEISSPIEQMLLSALLLIKETSEFPNADPEDFDEYMKFHGINIFPQHRIDKFRVDFYLEYYKQFRINKKTKETSGFSKTLIVELDSQQFHERTEQERRYEKMRERLLVSKGYKIFRYTGKEITDDPFKVALEIISYLTEKPEEDLNYFKEFEN